LTTFACVLGLGAGGLWLFPQFWHVRCHLLVQGSPSLAALGNPRRSIPWETDQPARGVAEEILSQASLDALIQETDLIRRTAASRAPLAKAFDAMYGAFGASPTPEERLRAIRNLLLTRLRVTEYQDSVEIDVVWTDRQLAHDIAARAQEIFFASRRQREVGVVLEAVRVLERQLEAADQEVDAALQAIDRLRSRRRVTRLETAAGVSPPREATEADEEELAHLRATLEETRTSIEGLEAKRWREWTDLEKRLMEAEALGSPEYIAILRLRQGAAVFEEEASRLRALRMDEARFNAEYTSRLSRGVPSSEERTDSAQPSLSILSPSEGPEEEEEQPVLVAEERLRLGRAVEWKHQLSENLDNARIELAIARGALSYRYAVLRPPELSREPLRPNRLVVLFGTVLCGIVLGAFAAAAVEWRATRPRLDSRSAMATTLLVTAILAIATVLTLLFAPSPALALAPAAVAVVAWAVATQPLHRTALVLVFLGLALESPGDASNKWHSPWASIGYLLNTNLNLSLPVESLRFTGIDLLLGAVSFVIVWRRLTRSALDREGNVPTARPLLTAAGVSIATILLLIAYGLARGGNPGQTLWQCHQIVMVPVVVILFHVALRGPRDLRGLGVAVLAAATLKAILALYVRYSSGLDGGALPTATSHADSMLFATAVCILVGLIFEAPTWRVMKWSAIMLPLLVLAMRANNRRLAWVEVAAGTFVMFLLSRRTRLKRMLTRAALLSFPLLLLYVVVGWNGTSRVFGPVAKLRSLADPATNRSTLEHEVENYELAMNWSQHPVLGLGFGHEYATRLEHGDISEIFPQWRYIPHNSILGLLAFGGILGFTGIFLVLTVGVFLALRAYWWGRDRLWRAAALATAGAVLVYLIQCFGDMGFVSWQSVFLVAPALCISGKLAVASGAWPAVLRVPGRVQAAAG